MMRDPMNERDFDAMLENAVPELPPEDIVADVTPWKKSMHRVLIGLALTSLTLNFWALNYILPASGRSSTTSAGQPIPVISARNPSSSGPHTGTETAVGAKQAAVPDVCCMTRTG